MSRKLLCAIGLCAFFAVGATTTQAVTVDISSPQEGTEVQPGGTIELAMVVTNDTEVRDCIAVTLKLVVEGIQHPVVARGYLRVKLQPGESVTETVALTVPADLNLPGPAPATVQAEATGKKSGTTDSDSVSLTLVPAP
ncbi:MAG: hypothetical protein V2A79_00795 [Planctomycetota bacterium]